MGFTYSGDPSKSDLDRLRFLLMDTNEKAAVFSDEELTFLISEYGTNDVMLQYQAFSQAAIKFAYSIKRSLGPQSEDPTARLNFFKAKADELKAKLVSKGLVVPRYQAPKMFYKGMMDNKPKPRSGRFV